jgi:hypothetical protein
MVRRAVIAGITLLHGDSVKRRNLGMNQEAAQKTRMKHTAAMSMPAAIESAGRDFSRSFKAALIMHPRGMYCQREKSRLDVVQRCRRGAEIIPGFWEQNS